MNPDELQAGPELDALVAFQVMGWKFGHGDDVGPVWTGPNGEWPPMDHAPPPYSTEIQWAWQVVEKLVKEKLYVDVGNGKNPSGPYWVCRIDEADPEGERIWQAYAKTPALAICLAALKSVGEK